MRTNTKPANVRDPRERRKILLEAKIHKEDDGGGGHEDKEEGEEEFHDVSVTVTQCRTFPLSPVCVQACTIMCDPQLDLVTLLMTQQ
jgi:hypothetical protein